jgi:GxxExxY protein
MAQMDADEPIDKSKDPQTFAIIGAAMEVHTEQGPGFAERVYQESLEIELGFRGIPFAREVEIPVYYKNRRLDAIYKADFICFESVIIEAKALAALSDAHMEQTLNYLKATKLQRGLLLNFGAPRLQYRRVVLNYH